MVVLLFFLISLRKNSWYPGTEQDIPRPCLLSIPPLKNVKRSVKEVEEMRDYSRAHGAAVRQTTNRPETTMARHGTMPEVIYQRLLYISEGVNESGVDESPAIISSRSDSWSDHLDEMPDCGRDAGDVDNEETEYDSSSDREETETDVSELNKGSTLLFGTTTRYGRRDRYFFNVS